MDFPPVLAQLSEQDMFVLSDCTVLNGSGYSRGSGHCEEAAESFLPRWCYACIRQHNSWCHWCFSADSFRCDSRCFSLKVSNTNLSIRGRRRETSSQTKCLPSHACCSVSVAQTGLAVDVADSPIGQRCSMKHGFTSLHLL